MASAATLGKEEWIDKGSVLCANVVATRHMKQSRLKLKLIKVRNSVVPPHGHFKCSIAEATVSIADIDHFHPHRKFCWRVLESEFVCRGQNQGYVHREEAGVAVGLIFKKGGTGRKTSTDTHEIRTAGVSVIAGEVQEASLDFKFTKLAFLFP